MAYVLQRYDPSDMSYDDVYNDIGDEIPIWHCIATDGTYVYYGITTDATVIKLDPSDMSIVDSWTEAGEEVQALYYDGTYLLAAVTGATINIVRIDPSDMSEVDRFVDDSEEPWLGTVVAITGDGTYYYAVDSTFAAIVKITASTMTLSAGVNKELWLVDAIWRASNLYVCCTTCLIKVSPSDLSTVETLDFPEGEEANSIDQSGNYIYVGTSTTPGKVYKILDQLAVGRSWGYIVH